jgi:alpha-tubulin suppressor-like RCC1 family protein
MKALMGLFLGSVLAGGCGPVEGGEEVAPAPVSQAVRSSPLATVAAGKEHALSRRPDGTVKAWGANSHGQLGNGTTTNSSTPVTVSGLSGMRAVGAGENHSFAIKDDTGTLWAWGRNSDGQLGDGTTGAKSTPVQVSGLTNVVAVAGGGVHSLALRGDGTVWAWGNNFHGQLGTGGGSSSVPVQVNLGGVSAVAIAAGNFHSLAVLSTGVVKAWGRNDQGQLGVSPLSVTKLTSPTDVSGVSNAVDVGAGNGHSLAVLSDGTVRAWGDNYMGQLGDGTTTDRSAPATVSGLTGATVVNGGRGQYVHSIALSSGSVWNWGSDSSGQLGDDVSLCPDRIDSTAVRTTPYAPGVVNVEYVASGEEFSVAQLSDGAVRSWGTNTYGRLGIGTAGGCYDLPQVVVGL